MGKPHYINAINDIYQKLLDCMIENGLTHFIDENFVNILGEVAVNAMKTYKVNDKASLCMKNHSKGDEDELTTDKLMEIIEGDTRLICISISDPYTIKNLVVDLTSDFLYKRKKQFKVRPYILFLFDEAQEFVPDLSNARGIEKECSIAVETLLRQGRKYGFGGCITTQRIAYLNTNALQQLHTYFVGTLPRPYDRNLVSNTFTIDQGLLEKTLEFAPGQWLLSSFIATGIENVPIFIKAQ